MDLHRIFIRHISYPIIQRRDGLRRLYSALHALEESQWLSRDEIENLQLTRLRSLLKHAWRHCRYYRRIFDDLGAHPDDFRSLSDLQEFPILTKAIIRENLSGLRADNIREGQVHFSETGGTSGVRMRFCRDNACLSEKAAATLRFERWTGWDIGAPRALAWPAEQDYVGYYTWKAKVRNALTKREVVLPAAVLNDSKIKSFVAQMKEKRPALLLGFATPLYLIADYILRNPESACKVPAVISTGEPLFPHQKKHFIEAFDCQVFDSYRTREVGIIAQECPEYNGMHINAESLYLETVEEKDTGLRKVLVTDFLNQGMPFIRYEIGDTGSLSERFCSCGRGLPLMNVGVGREADVMYTPRGEIISAVTMVLYLVDNGPAVGQVQIIQNALDCLTIRLTKDPLPNHSVFNHYRREIARLFGDEMRVSFELVDSIPREPSGKYRFAVCKLSAEEIDTAITLQGRHG